MLPRPPRILAASPVAWSADAPQGVHWTPFSTFERLTSPRPASMLTAASSDTASHTTLAPPLPGASLQNSLQNNIISRPRHYTLGHAADPGSLTPAQLRHAAKMARLSGLAYKQGEELAELLSREGLSLVARGQSHFTRCVAESALACTHMKQLKDLKQVPSCCVMLFRHRDGCRWYVADVLADEEDASPDKAEAGPAAERNSPAEPASSRRRPRQRVVMMRGVVSCTPTHSAASARQHAGYLGCCWTRCACATWLQVWRSGDFTTQLWADMMRFWPAPFEGPTTQPREALVAHAGMACQPDLSRVFSSIRSMQGGNVTKAACRHGGHGGGAAAGAAPLPG